MTTRKKNKAIKTIDSIYKYHSKSVDFAFYKKDKQVVIRKDGDFILIDLEDLKILNKMVKELGWSE